MNFAYCKYLLELKHQFSIAYNTRITTPAVLIRIYHEGVYGYGEASLPPYLTENQDSVIDFFYKAAALKFNDLSNLVTLLNKIDLLSNTDSAAKAALDIAFHDLLGKTRNLPVYKLFDIDNGDLPYTSFTIGIDKPEIMKEKLIDACHFKIIKVKLGTKDDREIIRFIRSETDKPLYVDINQGWQNKEEALELSYWLASQDVLLIEQPFPKEDLEKSRWLSERSPIPVIADESLRSYSDIEKVKNCFNGINIKLMKCAGIYEAHRMIIRARELGLKIMLGCMTETSCGISAAAQLAPLADFADLDGNVLIKNDPFGGLSINEGRLVQSGRPGLGIDLMSDLTFTELL